MTRIATRNRTLARFVANPSTFPSSDAMRSLMNQFANNNNCPSGRFMLARGLPEAIAFDKIQSKDSFVTEPKRKKQKVPSKFPIALYSLKESNI